VRGAQYDRFVAVRDRVRAVLDAAGHTEHGPDSPNGYKVLWALVPPKGFPVTEGEPIVSIGSPDESLLAGYLATLRAAGFTAEIARTRVQDASAVWIHRVLANPTGVSPTP